MYAGTRPVEAIQAAASAARNAAATARRAKADGARGARRAGDTPRPAIAALTP
jgi:hypothetical protein